MSRHTLDTSPFKPGETLFWREADLPTDTMVTFESYEDGGEFALVKVFGSTRRVPVRLLRRALPVW